MRNPRAGVCSTPYGGWAPWARVVVSCPMIVALLVAVLATMVALSRGGSLENLAATQVRWLPLLFGALAVQVAFDVADPAWLGEGGGLFVLLATNAAVVVFLTLNRHLPGMKVAAVGLLLNVIVIAANGAMPVSEPAAVTVGLADELRDPGVKHEILGDQTALPFLGDVIPIPGLRKIISVGDIVLAVGIGLFAYRRSLGEPEVREVAVSG